MSKISLSPDSNGTGIFTIASPNSDTNRTLTLPDDTGTIVTNSGNQAGSFTTLNTSGAVVFNDAGADVDFRVEGDTEPDLLFVDASADAIGFGTNAPISTEAGLDISSGGLSLIVGANNTSSTRSDATNKISRVASAHYTNAEEPVMLAFTENTSTTNEITFGGGSGITNAATTIMFRTAANNTTTSGTERMRIDASGRLLVAKTTDNVGTVGHTLWESGMADHTRDGEQCMRLNRLTSDGDIITFRKNSTTIGSIGRSGNLYIDAVSQGSLAIGGTILYNWDANQFFPQNDNARDLGFLTLRWDDVYATNGTIQTSDRNEKQDIEELTEAETRVAVAAKGLLRKYRWKSAVAEKGDDARIHFGIIAQDLQAAFEAEGLDAGRYAMFIKGEWWEKERVIPAVEAQEAVYETQTDEEGNETQVLVSEAVEAQPERTEIDIFESEEEAGEGAVRKERMGIRYNELLAFIIAAI